MRSVARIAQSVEQGIESPRVLGSIPSPGTTIQKNPPMAGFLLSDNRTLLSPAFPSLFPTVLYVKVTHEKDRTTLVTF